MRVEIIPVEKSKEIIFKLIELLSKFMNLANRRSILKNQLHFYMLAINNMKRKKLNYHLNWY